LVIYGPVRLLYLHYPTRTTIGSDFYTCTIRPGPQSGPTFIPARSDLIRRGLAIRSDADWRSGPTIIPACDYLALKLQKLQNRAARIITGANYSRRSSDILNELGWEKLSERRQKCKAVMMHKILNNKAPLCFLGLFRPETVVPIFMIFVLQQRMLNFH
jgi:hypothetical protein